ncbi:MAG: carboxypeptidase regulatory-like domain-containing protein [Cytophagaceae bacterium]|nr:carboxypeptidase regulatory-like domain-containing protein [Gemmatimonadaceae bacterium]
MGVIRLLLPVLILAPALPAQVVRGRVTEGVSGQALSGVVIELRSGDANGPRVGTSLSSSSGEYAVSAPAAGRYVVLAKRIGVRRFASEAFDLALGETAVRNLALDPVLYTLPEVVVTGLTHCDARARDGARVASLWEEARTALLATQLSLRDQLYKAHVTRYVRELEPRTRRILGETRSEVSGVVARPFLAADAESLSVHGYWVSRPDSGVTYYGPDADVLLSDAFLRDHCFREARAPRDRRGMVGLGFQPVPSRTVPDVVGVLWLDARSFELRFVEFAYSRNMSGTDSVDVRGEVHFARLPTGAWIIRRWFIRLPISARPTAPVTTLVTQAPWVLVRPVTLHLREEGGEVAAEALLSATATWSVRGQVRDSANQPLGDARVRLAGTRLVTTTTRAGTFTLDSVPPGRQVIVVEAAGYDSLGLAGGDVAIDVGPGMAALPTVRLLDTRQVHARLCVGLAPRRGRGSMRLFVRTSDGEPMVTRLPVSVSWREVAGRTRDSTYQMHELYTDSQGRVTVCDIPSDLDVSIVVARPEGGSEPVVTMRAPDRGTRAVWIRLSTP